MEDLHVAATASYNNASQELRDLAWNFFCSMDTNRDGRISFEEFVEFFGGCGYNWIDPNLFVELDRNRDRCLDFWEVLTLYYIMKTRGVWCKSCGACLMRMYFTCVQCFDSVGDTYDLCASCFSARRFQHHHASFLDSYMLLRFKRGLNPVAYVNLPLVPAVAANAPRSRQNWQIAFRALEMALSIGNILTSCSIM